MYDNFMNTFFCFSHLDILKDNEKYKKFIRNYKENINKKTIIVKFERFLYNKINR